MSTIEPDDEAARALIDSVFGDQEDPVFIDYTLYSRVQLLNAFEEARQDLADTGEMVFPKSDKAVELSAIYHGLLLEMKRRGLS